MRTVGQRLVEGLAARGVDVVFGIPGVHTIELYRGLAGSGIRHVTARHEQGAGFMADGYARGSGKPGVAFVITGPGVTNILTAMAQARADSVPMLVVSGVNRQPTLGRGFGHLHELPDQRGLMAQVALQSERVERPEDLAPALDRAFAAMLGARPGPVHLEVPLDVMPLPCDALPAPAAVPAPPDPAVARAGVLLAGAQAPLILAGGGAKRAGAALRTLAERLDAPVVLTVNARGLMHGHPLVVPASPSLHAVRDLISGADRVLAVGTELGPTDFDIYQRGGVPDLSGMIRIDIDPAQLARHEAALTIHAEAGAALAALAARLPARAGDGAARASAARKAAWDELDAGAQADVALIGAIRDALPGAVIVGDSTRMVYAGNLFYDHDRPGGCFNAATGFGALGHGVGAAVGAAIAEPGVPVVCLVGDGGLQFAPGEVMTAVDEGARVIFVVLNNHGFGEIALAMREAGSEVIGCDPRPPRLDLFAESCGIPFRSISCAPDALRAALHEVNGAATCGPAMIELRAGA
jgi:acetolactate synthase I/II/III large subunit